MVIVSVDQAHYRFLNDDSTESASTFKSVLDSSISMNTQTPFRLRVATNNGAGVGQSMGRQLQYNKNAAGWNNVTTSSSVVKEYNSAQVSDATATTQRISSGSFQAGQIKTTAGVTSSVSISSTTNIEDEWCITLVSSDVTGGDSIQFRLVADDGTVYSTYTNTPTVTVQNQLSAGAFNSLPG